MRTTRKLLVSGFKVSGLKSLVFGLWSLVFGLKSVVFGLILSLGISKTAFGGWTCVTSGAGWKRMSI